MARSGVTAMAVEWSFIVLSLLFIIMRLCIRLLYHYKKPNTSDILAVIGWIFALAAVSCDTITYRISGMNYNTFSPTNQELTTLLKIAYADDALNDVGFYFSKFSLLALYFNVISPVFAKLRISLYVITVYVIGACVVTWGFDLFWCRPIASNWSLKFEECHVFAQDLITNINWSLNISSDLAIFILPFFLFRHLNLSRRQSLGLIATFLLGAVTMFCSTTRFLVLKLAVINDYAPIYILYSMEINISLIVVSIPLLKPVLRGKRGWRSTGHDSEEHNPSTYLKREDLIMASV